MDAVKYHTCSECAREGRETRGSDHDDARRLRPVESSFTNVKGISFGTVSIKTAVTSP